MQSKIEEEYDNHESKESRKAEDQVNEQRYLTEEANRRAEEVNKGKGVLLERISQLEAGQTHAFQKRDFPAEQTGLKRPGEEHQDSPTPKMR